MLKSANEAAKKLELLGVTILTSQSTKEQVLTLANLAIKSGIKGVISSAQEYESVESLSKDLKIFLSRLTKMLRLLNMIKNELKATQSFVICQKMTLKCIVL